MKEFSGTCPVCSKEMNVSEYHCPSCDIRVKGDFGNSGLRKLSESQLKFVEIFLKNGGNIKLVEKDLKVSYPTVRKSLDSVIEALGYKKPNKKMNDLLEKVSRGEIKAEEAAEMMKQQK